MSGRIGSRSQGVRLINVILALAASAGCGIVEIRSPGGGQQDPQAVAVVAPDAGGNIGAASCGPPLAKTMYLKQARPLILDLALKSKPQGQFVPNNVFRYPNLFQAFPSNAKLDVLRRLPDEDGGECVYVEVRPSPGAADDAPFVSKVDWLTDTPKSETEISEREEAKNRAVLDAELKSGRCSDDHVTELRQALQMMKSVTGRNWDLANQSFLVATEKGVSFSFKTGMAGEYHFLSVSKYRTELVVSDSQGYPVKSESLLTEAVPFGFHYPSGSAALQAGAREDMSFKVTGSGGCTLVMAFRKD